MNIYTRTTFLVAVLLLFLTLLLCTYCPYLTYSADLLGVTRCLGPAMARLCPVPMCCGGGVGARVRVRVRVRLSGVFVFLACVRVERLVKEGSSRCVWTKPTRPRKQSSTTVRRNRIQFRCMKAWFLQYSRSKDGEGLFRLLRRAKTKLATAFNYFVIAFQNRIKPLFSDV